MSHSQVLKISDIRAADRLAYECRDLGHDPQRWLEHLLNGLSQLCHLPVGMHSELTGLDVRESPSLISVFEAGWPSEKLRRAFFYSNSDDPNRPEPFSVSPVDVRFRLALRNRRACTRARRDLIDDHAWRSHPVYANTHRPAEMDEILMSAARMPGRGSISLMAFGGRGHAPGPRERKILALVHHSIARDFGRRLTTDREPGRHRLTISQRQVFDELRLGHDIKTVAARLHRSRSTISEHVSHIYQAFGVRSRAELMAHLSGRSD